MYERAIYCTYQLRSSLLSFGVPPSPRCTLLTSWPIRAVFLRSPLSHQTTGLLRSTEHGGPLRTAGSHQKDMVSYSGRCVGCPGPACAVTVLSSVPWHRYYLTYVGTAYSNHPMTGKWVVASEWGVWALNSSRQLHSDASMYSVHTVCTHTHQLPAPTHVSTTVGVPPRPRKSPRKLRPLL